jgi:hypothetical protein
MRWQTAELVAIDAWRAKQEDKPSRADAIRRMVQIALTSSKPKPEARKASELAARAVERVVDKSVSVKEQRRRKRALIKGPEEFRDIRGDLPDSET